MALAWSLKGSNEGFPLDDTLVFGWKHQVITDRPRESEALIHNSERRNSSGTLNEAKDMTKGGLNLKDGVGWFG